MFKVKMKRTLLAFCSFLCGLFALAGVGAIADEKETSATSTTVTIDDVVAIGPDISVHQGSVNFATLDSVSDFVILRIGYGGNNPTLDTRFDSYLASAQARNLPIGVYIYSYADTTAEAIKEADWVVATLNAKGLNGKLQYPVYFDYEEASVWNRDVTTNTNVCNAFMDTVKAAGYYPGLYINGSMMNGAINKYDIHGDIWVAAYGCSWNYFNNNYNNSKVTMWQYATGEPQFGSQPGNIHLGAYYGVSSTYIDQNYCFVDYPSIIGGSTSTEPEVEELPTYGFGVTISEKDGEVDFNTMKSCSYTSTATGDTTTVDFALVRLGDATAKTIDAQFVRSMQELQKVGIYRGVTVDSSATTVEGAAAEAAWVATQLRRFGVGQVDYPIIYNYSYPLASTEWQYTVDLINAFCYEMKKQGGIAMLATNGSQYDTYTKNTNLNCDTFFAWYGGADATLNGEDPTTVALQKSDYYYNSGYSTVTIWQSSDGTTANGWKVSAADVGSRVYGWNVDGGCITHNYALLEYPNYMVTRELNYFEKPSYRVSTAISADGSLSTNVARAKEGETVTVTATPDQGYELDKIYLDGVALEGNTFVMPEKNVTVSATYNPILTIVGMSVRIVNPEGLRFVAQVREDLKDSYGADAKYGMILLPADMDDGAAWTVTYQDGEYVASDSRLLVIERGEWWNEELCAQNNIAEGFAAYSCALVAGEGYPESFYNRPITAVAFAIAENGTTTYTEKTTRSIAYAATIESMMEGYQSKELIEKIAGKAEISFAVGKDNRVKYDVNGSPVVKIGGIEATEFSSVTIEYASSDESVIKVVGGKLKAQNGGKATVTATLSVGGVKTIKKSVEVTSYGKELVAANTAIYYNDFESGFTAADELTAGPGGASSTVTDSAISGATSVQFETNETGLDAGFNTILQSSFGAQKGVCYLVAMRFKVVQSIIGGEFWFRLYGSGDTDHLQVNGIKLLDDGSIKDADNDRDVRTSYQYNEETGVITLMLYMTAREDGQVFQIASLEKGAWKFIVDDFAITTAPLYENDFEGSFVDSNVLRAGPGGATSLITNGALEGEKSLKVETNPNGETADWNTLATSDFGGVVNGYRYRVSMKLKAEKPDALTTGYVAFRLIGTSASTNVEGLFLKLENGTVVRQDAHLETADTVYAYDTDTTFSYDEATGVLTVDVYMTALEDNQAFYLMSIGAGNWSLTIDSVRFEKA